MPLHKIDQIGIYCTYKDRDLVFNFVTDPETSIIYELQNLVDPKEKHLNFLQQEISKSLQFKDRN